MNESGIRINQLRQLITILAHEIKHHSFSTLFKGTSAKRRTPSHTWTDYYHELSTYFDGWTLGLKIETYEDLRKLIIVYQMKQRTPADFKEHFLDDWTTINSPVEIVEKFEEYGDIKKTLKQKSVGAYFKGRQNFKGTEKFRKFESPRKFEHNRTDKKFPASYIRSHEAQLRKSSEKPRRFK
ncbi:hypothetical protein AVEN_143916-1 [Araneus ventricosus]|uniref:Uncharacterized protein n=1 Tax=Araneus ventricosus TaxID=182803 RepID=A0A4Y2ENN1_ARAVE|nr:hypothetical protein AVEN_143916-1 [Araneus ventricosus]